MPGSGASSKQGHIPTARLRILETTDLHMQLLGYDYFSEQDVVMRGLIPLTALIEDLRADKTITSLLFDNGDFLQGNPLADYLSAAENTDTPHPMIGAFNALDYDAVTLGNHEFNYGLPFLRKILRDAEFPVTCANIHLCKGTAFFAPFLILERDLACDDGHVRKINIGVIGFVPPQITKWDKVALDGAVCASDMVKSAQATIPLMRDAGADIIVGLCHTGIGAEAHHPGMENAAVPLAAVSGLDILLTGHTHEEFPGAHRQRTGIIDPVRGTLHGKPTVMAGSYGSCLGVIDLDLRWTDDQWLWDIGNIGLRRAVATNGSGTRLQQKLTQDVKNAHHATLRHIRRPVARTKVDLHSYFGTIDHDLSQQLLAQAKQAYVARVLTDTSFRDLPVLAATAPFRAGGHGGASHYTHIPPGPLTLRDASAIYPFANTLCAVRRSGAALRLWLEQSAVHFAQMIVGQADQDLLNPGSPSYNCDTIYGLEYEFDLSQPSHFDTEGLVADPAARRVRWLRYDGEDVRDDDQFIVAANTYRTNGGGGFPGVEADDILYRSVETVRDILINYVADRRVVDITPQTGRSFTALPDTSAIFLSAPAAQRFASGAITHLGAAEHGFDKFRLTF
ncbi:bifunctional 2',3'-cyclic-nucleotide 2'-phosphodiesterase/3'-nucleotidase [Yoonia sp. SS1-5]|uniref:Bifunctional 2',3'-cyclic-nucleotide 2'-phosphodiesterase/3'-nucleotidase n=1 Tax=Yoonia rhodophyticola TaxID=3137370 RepID=A0AAN0NLJ8_9RHOB